jgi:hypothetical protein
MVPADTAGGGRMVARHDGDVVPDDRLRTEGAYESESKIQERMAELLSFV